MKRKFKGLSFNNVVTFMISVIITVSCLITTAYASEMGNFSAQAIIPENQVDKNHTYFDLRLEPSQTQTVQLIVRNGGAQPITANVALNAASTGRGGLIVYSVPDIRDESLFVSITDIAKVVNPQVTVPASGSALVDIEIQMPEEPFDGVVLGGLVVTSDRRDDGGQNVQEGVQITNEYAYTIGLQISQNDTAVKPELHLKEIKPGLVNYHTAVSVNLQNSEAVVIKGMRVSAQVYKGGDVFRELSISNAEMAPNSNCDFVIDWQNERLQPGDYRLKLTAEHEGRLWEWDEEFSIQADEANEINSNATDLPAKNLAWLYTFISVLAVIIILIIIAFIIGRRSSKRDKN